MNKSNTGKIHVHVLVKLSSSNLSDATEIDEVLAAPSLHLGIARKLTIHVLPLPRLTKQQMLQVINDTKVMNGSTLHCRR